MRCPHCQGTGQIELTTSQCRSCKAVIVWVETLAGKNMPIDVEPSSTAGNVELSPRPAAVPLARVLAAAPAEEARAAGQELYVSHFGTCPEAERWRGTKR